MPTPVVVVATGGVPIVNTPQGTPMTPIAAAIGAMPVVVIVDAAQIGGMPVNLVKEDLSPWP